MDISDAAEQLHLLILGVNRHVEEFTNRTGIVIELDVRPNFRQAQTFDPNTTSDHRLIGYQTTHQIKALTSRKAAG